MLACPGLDATLLAVHLAALSSSSSAPRSQGEAASLRNAGQPARPRKILIVTRNGPGYVRSLGPKLWQMNSPSAFWMAF